MTLIRDHAALSDSWAVTHPQSNDTSSIPPPPEAILKFGVTADSPLNTYSAGKPLDPTARKYWGKRLDYIFYRQPKWRDGKPGNALPILKCVDCRVVLTEKVPGEQFSFSDHFGLESTLEIFDPQPAASEDPLSQVPEQTELSNAAISTTIQALASCYTFSRHRARRELTVFGLCLLLLVGVIIGSSWLPHAWINPIFILFTVVVAWAATTMLYEGFLYGNWECNALMNTIEELEIHKKGLEIQGGRTSPQ